MPTYRFDVQQKTGDKRRFPLNGSNGITAAPWIQAPDGAKATAKLYSQYSNWTCPEWTVIPVLVDGCANCGVDIAGQCVCGRSHWVVTGRVVGGTVPVQDTETVVVADNATMARSMAIDIMRGWSAWREGTAIVVSSVKELTICPVCKGVDPLLYRCSTCLGDGVITVEPAVKP